MSTIISQCQNSQNELIQIQRVDSGDFKGQHVLVIHDDKHVSDTRAIHLLDKETVEWLLEELPKL